MTQKQFDLAFKRFSRCMKDNGYYKPIMDYLFPPGRTKKDLLDDLNDESQHNNFAMVLGYVNLLGPSYKKYGQQHWETIVKIPYCLWLTECRNNYKEYLGRI